MNRRAFLRSAAAACLAGSTWPVEAFTVQDRRSERLRLEGERRRARGEWGWGPASSDIRSTQARQHGISRPSLAELFPDLRRHFIFEYYPWYRLNPVTHWDEAGRHPPIDLASNYMPRLGAYDSGSRAVIEQHAKWIADTGVGAINVSWWGQGSDPDRLVPLIMDVMGSYDIHVTFHIEPYSDNHAMNYAKDIQYLITEYGDRRHWDAFLLLTDALGNTGPVFKSFRTILPRTQTDCHGVTTNVPDYTLDTVWRQQTQAVRDLFRGDFDHVWMLADALAFDRVQAGGFDGIAIYSNFVTPDTWQGHAENCTHWNLVYSFNVNPGYDAVFERQVPPGSCDMPLPFAPGGGTYDWSQASERERAEAASVSRITDSMATTIAVQTSAELFNAKRGFFLTYVNSFNEWHEGHQFEPTKDAADLTAAERAIGYHNPADGSYRLKRLKEQLAPILGR